MKYIAGYMLLALGGKKDVSEKDLSDFLKACDCAVDAAQAKAVVDALKGKNIAELCQKGLPKLSSLAPAHGAAAHAAPAEAKAADKGADKGAKKDDKGGDKGGKDKGAKKEEEKKKEEPPADEAADLGDLFG